MLVSQFARLVPLSAPLLSFSCTKKRRLLRRPRLTWHRSMSPVMSTSFLIISRCWTVSYAADISTNAALLSSIFRSRLRCCRVKLGSWPTHDRPGMKPAWYFVNFSSTRGIYAHQYQSFVERIRNTQQRYWAVAFWGGGVLHRLWYGYYLCFTPDRWDMLCACTFDEHVQEPRFSFVANML